MTEDEAQFWLRQTFGEPALARLQAFVNLLLDESAHQNLVAGSTISEIWSRHVVDSAQLLSHAPARGMWVDIGTGGGFPGMIVAILRDDVTTLLEPRRRRADFLKRAARSLGLARTQLVEETAKRAQFSRSAAIVSARAVAPAGDLIRDAQHFSDSSTVFILPKGASAKNELESVKAKWHGVFHVEQSLTEEKAGILVGTGVTPR